MDLFLDLFVNKRRMLENLAKGQSLHQDLKITDKKKAHRSELFP